MYRNADFLMDETKVTTAYNKIEVNVRVSTVGLGRTIFLAFTNGDAEYRIPLLEQSYDNLVGFLIKFGDKLTECQYEDSEIGPES